MRGPVFLTIGLLTVLCCPVSRAAPFQRDSLDTSRAPFRLKWISELGAESITVPGRFVREEAPNPSSPAVGVGGVVFAAVPGAVYAFSMGGDGPLSKLNRIRADSAIAYSFAVGRNEIVVAGDDGSVTLWSGFRAALSPSGVGVGPHATNRDGVPGTVRWRLPLQERVMSVSWDGGDRVWVASRENRLLAVAAGDGTVLWSANIEGKAEAPAVSDERSVFVATKSNRLLRLDAATGAVRWKRDLPAPVLHPPALLGEARKLVLCATRSGHLQAYDVESGQLRWSVSLADRLAGPPVAAMDLVAVVTADGAVHGFDLAGQPKWKAPEAAKGAADLYFDKLSDKAPRLLVASNILTALDTSTGARLNAYPEGALADLKRRFLEAVMEGGRAYSEREKEVIRENEAFSISGTLFGEIQAGAHAIAFGTEEGWIYVFDSASLRPSARYRAGLRSSQEPAIAEETVFVVGGGEEIFGLDPSTGQVRWKRSVGAAVDQIATGASLAVIAGGRLSALSLKTGARQWTAPVEFRSLGTRVRGLDGSDPDNVPWLAADEKGLLHAFDVSGRSLGEPLQTGGELVTIVPLGSPSWAAVTRSGRVVGVTWSSLSENGAGGARDGRLTKSWEIDLGAPIADAKPSLARLILLTESGYLASLEDGKEQWRAPLADSSNYRLTPVGSYAVLSGKNDLRVYDVRSGELTFSRAVSAAVVGATVKEGSLLWLDSSGKAHRASMQGAAQVESYDLGLPLEWARPTVDGFIVTTTAGEVGFVEVNEGGKRP